MFKKCFASFLFSVVSILMFGSAYAYADTDDMGVIQSTTTAPACTIPVPIGKKTFTNTPVEVPVVSCDPAKAKPIGVGSVAHGGDVINVAVDIGPFDQPVDVSFGLFSASFDASDIYFLNIFNKITSLQKEFEEESGTQSTASNSNGNGNDQGSNHTKPKKNFKKLIAWKSNVLEVTETIAGPVNVKDFPSGLYVLVLNVTRVSPSEDNFDRFYRWVTYFIVPDISQ